MRARLQWIRRKVRTGEKEGWGGINGGLPPESNRTLAKGISSPSRRPKLQKVCPKLEVGVSNPLCGCKSMQPDSGLSPFIHSHSFAVLALSLNPPPPHPTPHPHPSTTAHPRLYPRPGNVNFCTMPSAQISGICSPLLFSSLLIHSSPLSRSLLCFLSSLALSHCASPSYRQGGSELVG